MQQVNWGIIGCGNVTEVKSGPAFAKVPRSMLAAVMRRNTEKARDYAQRHGVSRWYDDAQLLIDDPVVNAVYIATPPDAHEDYAIRTLRAGKPVYLEKPMALDAAAAKRIAAVAQETGTPLCIAHYRRQQPLFLAVKNLLDAGTIGRVQMARLELFQPHESDLIARTDENWRLDPNRSGGGLFHDLAPHQLDLMSYFFGRYKSACGLSCNTGGWYEADDTTSGQIVFESGVLFEGTWCFAAHRTADVCTITGTEGELQFSIFGRAPLVLNTARGREEQDFDPLLHVQQPMIEAVVKYILGEGDNPCPAAAGVESMELIDRFTGK